MGIAITVRAAVASKGPPCYQATMPDPIQTLRTLTEDDIAEALKDATFGDWPKDNAALVELVQRVLDIKFGEDDGFVAIPRLP